MIALENLEQSTEGAISSSVILVLVDILSMTTVASLTPIQAVPLITMQHSSKINTLRFGKDPHSLIDRPKLALNFHNCRPASWQPWNEKVVGFGLSGRSWRLHCWLYWTGKAFSRKVESLALPHRSTQRILVQL